MRRAHTLLRSAGGTRTPTARKLALAFGCVPILALAACSSDEGLVSPGDDNRTAVEKKIGVNWFVDIDPVAKTARTAIPTGNPEPIVKSNG